MLRAHSSTKHWYHEGEKEDVWWLQQRLMGNTNHRHERQAFDVYQ
jgi:hypothetical protein